MKAIIALPLVFTVSFSAKYFTSDEIYTTKALAQAYCEGEGTNLASIHDFADLELAEELCSDLPSASGTLGCWLGLQQADESSSWLWDDGTPFDYGSSFGGVTPWNSGEPNGANGENCLHIASHVGWNWNDLPCNGPYSQYALCNDETSSSSTLTTMPILFWDFEAQEAGASLVPDAISGNSDYAMELLQGAAITSEGLDCNGGFARTVANIPSSVFGGADGATPAHSLEAKFKLTTLDQWATSPIALDSAYGPTGTYQHAQFDAIVYNENGAGGGDKMYIAGSDYHRRSKKPMEGDGAVPETAVDEYVHVVITYDPTANQVTMYRNGEAYGDSYAPGGGFMKFYDYTRALACVRADRYTFGGHVASLVGIITGVAVYDEVLSAATVVKHYTHFTGDLCRAVHCGDDGDACTVEYCDPSTGECTSSALDCVDEDACTVDTCDSSVGCVHTDLPCSDGNICNGEEACVEGECISPNDFECPSNFVCNTEANECLRDCSLFAIDGYLTDCSVEFDEHSNDLASLESGLSALSVTVTGVDERVTANEEDIAAGAGLISELQTSTGEIAADVETNAADIGANTASIGTNTGNIATNTADIGSNTGNIATNTAGVSENAAGVVANGEGVTTNAENIGSNADGIASNLETIESHAASDLESFGALEERVGTLEERIYSFAPLSDKGEGDGANSLNGPNENSSKQSVGIVPDFSAYHNELIVCLVVMNAALVLLLVCIGVCYCKGEKRVIYVDRKSSRYAPVEMYSSGYDEEARLKDNKH